MTDVPVVMPDTVPDDEPIVAMDGDPDIHVPPGVASVSVVVVPEQSTLAPAMGDGSGLTVTMMVV